jgi:hypothetical protein
MSSMLVKKTRPVSGEKPERKPVLLATATASHPVAKNITDLRLTRRESGPRVAQSQPLGFCVNVCFLGEINQIKILCSR